MNAIMIKTEAERASKQIYSFAFKTWIEKSMLTETRLNNAYCKVAYTNDFLGLGFEEVKALALRNELTISQVQSLVHALGVDMKYNIVRTATTIVFEVIIGWCRIVVEHLRHHSVKAEAI